MEVVQGSILCFRTTGELVSVIGLVEPGSRVYVRRPVMQERGISHAADVVYLSELETVEEHLRREAKEMVLKVEIQNEMQEEMESKRKGKPLPELVN
jgi:hypothetical protein